MIAVRELAKVVHSPLCKGRVLLMMTGYMDESGHSKDKACRFVGLGGLIAPTETWERFEADWKAALNEFSGGKAFHMKEFAHNQGLYKGWDKSKREAFFGKLIGAIVNSGAEPIGCAVSLDDFQQLDPRDQKACRDPYFVAFQEVTKFMTSAPLPGEVIEKVAMVYAYQQEFGATEAGKAQQLWHTVKDNFGFGLLMGSYTSARPEDLLPLQAADLFAYEMTREYEAWLKQPLRPMRWGLKQIIRAVPKNELLMIKLYTFETLVDMIINSSPPYRIDPQQMVHFALTSFRTLDFTRNMLLERAWA